MDIMELMDSLDNFKIVNSNTLKYNGDKYTNYAIYGNEKEALPLVEDFFKDNDTNYIIVDLNDEQDLNRDLITLAKELVEKKAVLILKGFGNVDNLKRNRFSTIYKDLSINGAKIRYLGTIAFMDKNIYSLDLDEEIVFKKIR